MKSLIICLLSISVFFGCSKNSGSSPESNSEVTNTPVDNTVIQEEYLVLSDIATDSIIISFPNITDGVQTIEKALYLVNNTGAPLSLVDLSTTFAGSDVYAIKESTCGAQLADERSCKYVFTMSYVQSSTYDDLVFDAVSGGANVTLNGAVDGNFGLIPEDKISYNSNGSRFIAYQGDTLSRKVRIFNPTSKSITLNYSDIASSPFSYGSDNTCQDGVALPSKTSCMLHIEYSYDSNDDELDKSYSIQIIGAEGTTLPEIAFSYKSIHPILGPDLELVSGDGQLDAVVSEGAQIEQRLVFRNRKNVPVTVPQIVDSQGVNVGFDIKSDSCSNQELAVDAICSIIISYSGEAGVSSVASSFEILPDLTVQIEAGQAKYDEAKFGQAVFQ